MVLPNQDIHRKAHGARQNAVTHLITSYTDAQFVNDSDDEQ